MRQRIFIVLFLIVLFDLIILLLYSGLFYVTISVDNVIGWFGLAIFLMHIKLCFY